MAPVLSTETRSGLVKEKNTVGSNDREKTDKAWMMYKNRGRHSTTYKCRI